MLYELLWVSPESSTEEIRAHFKQLTLAVHPDRNPVNPDLATSAFREIEYAANILTNPISRIIYDLHGKTGLENYENNLIHFSDFDKEDPDLRDKVLSRYRIVQAYDKNNKAFQRVDGQHLKVQTNFMFWFLANNERWMLPRPRARFDSINYRASLKYSKLGTLIFDLQGRGDGIFPNLTHQTSFLLSLFNKNFDVIINNEIIDPRNFSIEVTKWSQTNLSHKLILGFHNLVPSITLRNIYMNSGFYCQFYTTLSTVGLHSGLVLSKGFELTDKVSYNGILKTNFTDYNFNHKIGVKLSPRTSIYFKLGTVSNLSEIHPNEYAVKLEYKDPESQYAFSLSTFLKDGYMLGIKPAINFNNVRLSFPCILSKTPNMMGFPIKVCVGLMALAGLVFYDWEETEKDRKSSPNEKKSSLHNITKHLVDEKAQEELERFHDQCQTFNEIQMKDSQSAPQTDEIPSESLYICVAVLCPSSLRSKVLSHLKTGIKSLKNPSKPTADLKKTLEDHLSEQALSCIVTSSLSKNIIMNSVGSNVQKIIDEEAVPLKMDAGEEEQMELLVYYWLNGKFSLETFDKDIIIGRGKTK